jgi:hypothetical protein
MAAHDTRRRSGGALLDDQVYPQGQQLPDDSSAAELAAPINRSAARLVERAHRLAD